MNVATRIPCPRPLRCHSMRCDDGLKADPAAGMSSATVMRISNCGMVIIKGTILDYYTILSLYLVHLLHLIATIIAVSHDHDRDHISLQPELRINCRLFSLSCPFGRFYMFQERSRTQITQQYNNENRTQRSSCAWCCIVIRRMLKIVIKSIPIASLLYSSAPLDAPFKASTPKRRKPRFVAISSAVRPCWLVTAAGAKASSKIKFCQEETISQYRKHP